MSELQQKRRELQLLKRKHELEKDLPHVYKKHYKWSRAFNDSLNRFNCICAANQIGKSTAAIRKCIDDATNPKKWEILWPKLAGKNPDQFWYFYPDKATLNREVQSKWLKWLPQGGMTIDQQYGWKLVKRGGDIAGIIFNTGVQVYFFTWSQDTSVIQASTVHQIFGDEEMPEKFYSELALRLTRTNGIMNVVFTPTLNQEFWKDVIEGDVFPDAFKQQVSMYDCIGYDDGSASDFNEALIHEVIKKCKNETEIQRRVFGKFITEGGRAYYAYESGRHLVERHDVAGWLMYAGVDSGSGGEKNHPAAIIFVAVRSDFTEARVVDAWRGDGIETTSGDLLNKYNELSRPYAVVSKCFDPAGVEFGLLSARAGLGFIKAIKKREYGEETVNTMFKYDMLKLFDDNEEVLKLDRELNHLMFGVRVGKAKSGDDLADALRYCIMQIPFNWEKIDELALKDLEEREVITRKPKTAADFQTEQINLRRGLEADGTERKNEDDWTIEQELGFWNEFY
jgi:phage terminase large subunit-like protein